MSVHEPPKTSEAAPAKSRPELVTNEGRDLHQLGTPASRIPAVWLRELKRLKAVARSTNRRRDWLACEVHQAGIVARMERGKP